MDKSPDAFRTISEVADFLETPAHVLRFWESRFPQIKPVKRAGGRRYYRPADVALLAGIRQLLHQDGMTIRGVQKILRDQGVRHVIRLSDPHFDGLLDPEGDTEAPAPEIGPEGTGCEAEDAVKIVDLTDWRQTSGHAKAESTDDLPRTEAELEALVALALAPVSEELPKTEQAQSPPLLGQTNDEALDDEPLQWSLFDMDDGDAAEHSLPAHLPPSVSDLPPLDVSSSKHAAQAHDSLVSDHETHRTASPEAQGMTAPDEVADAEGNDEPESQVMPESVVPSGHVTDAGLHAVSDRPWLPARLRALHAQGETRQRAELLALLPRARALLASFRGAL